MEKLFFERFYRNRLLLLLLLFFFYIQKMKIQNVTNPKCKIYCIDLWILTELAIVGKKLSNIVLGNFERKKKRNLLDILGWIDKYK